MHCIAWNPNAQVLGFALGRGPLEMPLNALQFGVVQVLPVTPQDGARGQSPSACTRCTVAQRQTQPRRRCSAAPPHVVMQDLSDRVMSSR